MSKEIEILNKLNESEQTTILSLISRSSTDLHPIEIDGLSYQIPNKVYDLIDNLALQIKELASYRDSNFIN